MVFKPRVNIDLHIHTTASDGSFSPSEILALAQENHLAAFSVTDHDTTDGVSELLTVCSNKDIRFLPGVEITAQGPTDAGLSDSLHILGYGIRVDDPELDRMLRKLQDARDDRTPLILERLQQLGIDLTYPELAELFPGPQLGRPHIAQLLARKGYAASIDDAFDRYLGKGKPAYVDKFRVSYRQAIEAVRHAGGVAVLAHPFLCELSDAGLESLIRRLEEAGLRGIEVYYPEHTPAQTRFYKSLTERYGLLATGGTDFHGAATPGISIGTGHGDLCVPFEVYEKILQSL